jgi:pimeloyl-ACP methyl ester carboxylesterase
MRPLLNALLYLPSRRIEQTPAYAGLAYRELELGTADGERLHGWWVLRRAPALGHLLLCHGNAGNVGDRVAHAAVLTAVGFDVLLFDYRGYGHSSGRPAEQGTYHDARAALACLLRQAEVDSSRVLYLGESLGAAVALELAIGHPPAGLVLLSLRAPVLILHGEDDAIVPAEHARALFDAAPDPKRLRLVPGIGHNDLISHAGTRVAQEIASWAGQG